MARRMCATTPASPPATAIARPAASRGAAAGRGQPRCAAGAAPGGSRCVATAASVALPAMRVATTQHAQQQQLLQHRMRQRLQRRRAVAASAAEAAVAASSRPAPKREEVFTGHPSNNVSDYIYGKMGENLHMQPSHPIGIIKQGACACACVCVCARVFTFMFGEYIWKHSYPPQCRHATGTRSTHMSVHTLSLHTLDGHVCTSVDATAKASSYG
eukprot:353747-Chlamydomonas_euryale.AAC.6